jgi:hypothetical protein
LPLQGENNLTASHTQGVALCWTIMRFQRKTKVAYNKRTFKLDNFCR